MKRLDEHVKKIGEISERIRGDHDELIELNRIQSDLFSMSTNLDHVHHALTKVWREMTAAYTAHPSAELQAWSNELGELGNILAEIDGFRKIEE